MKAIKKNRKLRGILFMVLIALLPLFSCDKMEDNYSEYLTPRSYSPKVINLSAMAGYKTVDLSWENPEGQIAKKIMITYEEEEIILDEMVDTFSLEELEIKGYEILVFTLDAHGNKSVPASVYVFPNGENDR
jgi:hypothetical protein